MTIPLSQKGLEDFYWWFMRITIRWWTLGRLVVCDNLALKQLLKPKRTSNL
jgi:hypothetical protein